MGLHRDTASGHYTDARPDRVTRSFRLAGAWPGHPRAAWQWLRLLVDVRAKPGHERGYDPTCSDTALRRDGGMIGCGTRPIERDVLGRVRGVLELEAVGVDRKDRRL